MIELEAEVFKEDPDTQNLHHFDRTQNRTDKNESTTYRWR